MPIVNISDAGSSSPYPRHQAVFLSNHITQLETILQTYVRNPNQVNYDSLMNHITLTQNQIVQLMQDENNTLHNDLQTMQNELENINDQVSTIQNLTTEMHICEQSLKDQYLTPNEKNLIEKEFSADKEQLNIVKTKVKDTVQKLNIFISKLDSNA